MTLNRDEQHAVQAMPVDNSGANKTSTDGELTGFTLIQCVVDGSFTVERVGETDATYVMTESRVKSLQANDKITIVSGTFDLAR